MDQYLSQVVIVIITGIFGLITLYFQKKQDKVVVKIDKRTVFIEKKEAIKQKLNKKEKEKEDATHEVMMLILDTNMAILKNSQINRNDNIDESIFRKSEELKDKFGRISEEIEDINKEYELVIEMASQFQKEIESEDNKSK